MTASGFRVERLALPAGALVVAMALGGYAYRSARDLGDPHFLTGYVLLGLMLGLVLLRGRKVLSMVPLGRAAFWLRLHVVGGFLAVVVFWLHTGALWPMGRYEQVLAGLFYFVSASGIFGYLVQRAYPSRLTQTGHEIIYERIPAAIAELRAAAEDVILECGEKTGSDTLAKYYVETFEWFFHQPRFFASNAVGAARGAHWTRHHCGTVGRYLSSAEEPYLDKLVDLLAAKVVIDTHYAAQRIMKTWLWGHVPASMALIVLAIWHFLAVNAYAS